MQPEQLRQYSALALLVAAIALLQYHAIQFWAEHVDPLTGWAWSLLLEGSALWLWSSSRLIHRSLGAVATVLVLAGPLYHVSAPLVTEWQATDRGADAREASRMALTAEIASLEASLATYLDNSQRRAGWAGRIDRAEERLAEARGELQTVIAGGAAPTRMAWQNQAVIGMQAIALVLFQILSVIAIRTLAVAAAARQQKKPLHQLLDEHLQLRPTVATGARPASVA